MDLAPVHELRVETQRHVVEEQPLARAADVDPPLVAGECAERAERIVSVETKVAGEVIPGPEGNADERGVSLEPDLRDRSQRAVPTCRPEHIRRGRSRDLRRVFALTQDMRFDPE